MVDDPDPAGERVGLLQVLGREEDGDSLLGGQPADLLPEGRAALDVEPSRRLVEEEDARPVDECQRQVEPPSHAAGVVAHFALRRLREADPLEQLGGPSPALGLVQPVQGGLQSHVLAAAEQRVECRLLQRRPDRGAHPRPFADDVEARHPRRPRGRWQQRRQHQHGRRLARPVGPEEAVDLALLDSQVDSVDRARPVLELAHERIGFDAPAVPLTTRHRPQASAGD